MTESPTGAARILSAPALSVAFASANSGYLVVEPSPGSCTLLGFELDSRGQIQPSRESILDFETGETAVLVAVDERDRPLLVRGRLRTYSSRRFSNELEPSIEEWLQAQGTPGRPYPTTGSAADVRQMIAAETVTLNPNRTATNPSWTSLDFDGSLEPVAMVRRPEGPVDLIASASPVDLEGMIASELLIFPDLGSSLASVHLSKLAGHDVTRLVARERRDGGVVVVVLDSKRSISALEIGVRRDRPTVRSVNPPALRVLSHDWLPTSGVSLSTRQAIEIGPGLIVTEEVV